MALPEAAGDAGADAAAVGLDDGQGVLDALEIAVAVDAGEADDAAVAVADAVAVAEEDGLALADVAWMQTDACGASSV